MRSYPNISTPFILLSICILSACGKKIEETKPVIETVSQNVFTSGLLKAEDQYKLIAQSSGYITAIYFEEGDTIKKNQTLIELQDDQSQINHEAAIELLKIAEREAQPNAPLIEQAKLNIRIAEDKLELDKKNAERYERLWSKKSVAKIDYENAQNRYSNSLKELQIAKENLENIITELNNKVTDREITKRLNANTNSKRKLKALQSGRVYSKHKSLGDYVRQGDIIAEIANPNIIYALVNIDESSIAKVKEGQNANLTLNINNNKVYKTYVKEILPVFNEQDQSFLCKLYFSDSLDFRILNTQVQAHIELAEPTEALLIPRNYLDFGGHVQIKGQEEKTKVETKFISTDWVQVISGIDENTILITDNIKQNN